MSSLSELLNKHSVEGVENLGIVCSIFCNAKKTESGSKLLTILYNSTIDELEEIRSLCLKILEERIAYEMKNLSTSNKTDDFERDSLLFPKEELDIELHRIQL